VADVQQRVVGERLSALFSLPASVRGRPSMTRRGYLLAAVILALAVGYLAGYRAATAADGDPRRFVPVPPDPAWRDCYLDDMAGLA